MAGSDVKAVMGEFFAAFACADMERIAACLDDDFVWTLPTGESDPHGLVVRGKAAARAYLQQRFFDDKANAPVFSGVRLEYSGELALMRFRVQVPASGGKMKVDAAGLEVYRVVNGKIRSKEAYWKQVSWPDAR